MDKKRVGRPNIGKQPTKAISVTLPGEIYKLLQAAAAQTGESRSQLISRLIGSMVVNIRD